MDRQKNLLKQVKTAISEGLVEEPFRSSDFRFLKNSPSFLSKHAVGNGKYKEYFIRYKRGLYKLK